MLIVLFDDTKFLASTARAFCGIDGPPIRYLYAETVPLNDTSRSGWSYGEELFDCRNAERLLHLAPAKVAIFIQGLSTTNATAFMSIQRRICAPVVIWRCFGADFYYNFHHRSLYEPLTARLLLHGFDCRTRLKAIPGVNAMNRRLRAAPIRRIIEGEVTHVVPVLAYEYYLIREVLDTTAGYMRFTGAVKLDSPYLDGENYLLGNSADPSNNHLDALVTLRERVNLVGSQKIIVPLSYGNPAYARVIIRKGRELFGDAFEPLTEFLPVEQYQLRLASCRHVILNHLRQQAVGNLVLALANGSNVYMNVRNPAYAHFKYFLKADVFTLDALATTPAANGVKNRSVLDAEYGDAQCRCSAENLLRLVPG